jgi:hypothetical protein
MNDLFDVVLSYFLEQGWPIEQHEELPVLRLEYEGEHGSWFCYARVREDADQFLFLSIFPEKVPEDKLLSVAEYLTRANFGLNIGNFEMDFEDGEVRYKTSIDVTEESLTFGLIDPLVKASFVSMDDYLPGLKAVIAGEKTPKKAIEETMTRIREEEDSYDLLL